MNHVNSKGYAIGLRCAGAVRSARNPSAVNEDLRGRLQPYTGEKIEVSNASGMQADMRADMRAGVRGDPPWFDRRKQEGTAATRREVQTGCALVVAGEIKDDTS